MGAWVGWSRRLVLALDTVAAVLAFLLACITLVWQASGPGFSYDEGLHRYDLQAQPAHADQAESPHSPTNDVQSSGPLASSRTALPAAETTLAARGVDGIAKPTIGALTREQDAALNAALRDPNKLHKIFDAPKHKLGPLVQELGSREAVLREAVLAVPPSQTGVFEVTTQLGRHSLTVRGRVVNDVPRIGTTFVP